MSESIRDRSLGVFLSASVPLRIMAMQANEGGGPTREQLQSCRNISDVLGERGDILLFGEGQRSEVADLANQLAQAVAVLAFAPGGVHVFGQTFQAKKIE